MTTTYHDSKGRDVLISDMATPHLRSALAKLIRIRDFADDVDLEVTDRSAEIAAMTADLERRDAEYAAQQEAEAND